MIVKVSLSEYMQALLTEAAKLTHTTQKGALERLLVQIELFARNEKLDLGFEWTEAITKLRSLAVNPARVLTPGASRSEDHIPINFDVSLLETSAKCKSGFTGVYAVNGTGFRSLVPDPKTAGSRYLGTWHTALDAAIDRYRWYEEHGLPYGNIARYVEDFQKRHADWSVERCLLASYQFANSTDISALKWPFTVDQIVRTIARYREVHGLPDEPLPRSGESAAPRRTKRSTVAEEHGTLFSDDDPVDPIDSDGDDDGLS